MVTNFDDVRGVSDSDLAPGLEFEPYVNRLHLGPQADPAAILPFAAEHEVLEWTWAGGLVRRPLTLQFDTDLPRAVLEAAGEAIRRHPAVNLYVYGDADPGLSWASHFDDVRHLHMALDVPDYEPLTALSALRTLDIGTPDIRRQPSLTFLRDLTQLRTLGLEGFARDLEVIADLPHLKGLGLRAMKIKTYEQLRGHPGLETFAVFSGGLRDLVTSPQSRRSRTCGDSRCSGCGSSTRMTSPHSATAQHWRPSAWQPFATSHRSGP
jgi:hypothetical protein